MSARAPRPDPAPGRWRALATRLTLCALALALIDFAFAGRADARLLAALVGTWGSVALLALPLARPAQATWRSLDLAGRVRAAFEAARRGTGPQSIPAAARLVGVSVALLGWLAGGLIGLTWLIANHQTALLIAAAFMGLQLVLVALCAFVGYGLERALRRRGRLTLRRASIAIAALGLAGLAALHFTVLHRLPQPGPAPLLSLVALLIVARTSRGIGGHRAAFVALLAAPLLFAVALQDGATRAAVTRAAPTAQRLLLPLFTASDVDRDGVPSLPDLRDCGPFDPTVHPYAADPPGDGIDQNCDGVDGGPVAEPLAPMPGKAPTVRPNIVLITVDSLRADHLSLYGYGRPTTPQLDGWAARGVVFERAWTADSGTGPSLWSLMAGTAPFEAVLNTDKGWPPRFPVEQTTLVDRLGEVGYRTEAVLCGSVFRRRSGIRRGFNAWTELCDRDPGALGERVTRRAKQRLRRNTRHRKGRREQPYFLWVHYYDPHAGYLEHDDIELPGGGGLPEKLRRYDEEIAYTDRELGRLKAAIDQIPGDPWVFLTADHGENFDEHGRAPHARTLYRPVTHVPLVAWGPSARPRRVDAPVAMIDLHPTILELAGLDPGRSATRRSLLSVIQGGPPDRARLIYQENSFARPKRHTRAVVGQRYHLIHDLTAGHSELYDLADDFGERRDLSGTGLPDEARLEAALRRFTTVSRLPPAYAR